MVNSLKNLGKVTESLDDTTIGKFAEKVSLLTEKLGPLSEKMTTIKAGFSAINSNARSASSSISKFDDEIDASSHNLSNFIEIIRTAADSIRALIQKYGEYVKLAIEWDGIAARFGRSFGSQAQETYDWIQRLNEAMGINVQQFMQYSSLYAQMLTGFGVANEDAGKMALGYTELTYDIWASANDRYKTFEDAAEAVASAIAGEVEPIRRAGFTIVEATLAETAAYHGLDISLANATEAQKSYLRYLTLVDQAHSTGTIGVYASELNTAEGLTRTFTQQLKSLAQAFGSLFLPIIVKFVPYLQAFVELLTEAVHWLAGLLGIKIQDISDTWNNFDAGVGAIDKVANSAGGATDALDSATKAAKELKNATLGIDELNVISPSSAAGGANGGSGSGGAGDNGFAGLDVGSLWDETIFDTIQSDVDAIKEKLRGWMPVIGGVAAAFAGLRLVSLLDDIKLIEGTKLFSGKLTEFMSKAKDGGFVAALAATFPVITKAITAIGKFFGDFGAFIALSKEFGVMQAFSAWFPKVASALSNISSKLGPIGAIIAAIVAAIAFLVENWEKMKEVAKGFFDENIAPKFEEIKKHIDKMKEALEPLAPVFEWVGEAVKWCGEALGWLIEAIGGVVVALVGGQLAGAFNSIVSVIEGFVQFVSGAVQTIRGLFELFVGIITFDGEKITEAWAFIYSGFTDFFVGLYDMTIGALAEFSNGIFGWYKKMWEAFAVPDTANEIIEWFTDFPSKTWGYIVDAFTNTPIGKFLTEKFTEAWDAVKTWWSKKPSLSTYTPSIGKIWENLKASWETAKTWWSKNRGSLSTYTPSIGKIWEKLKSAWTSAKDWWNKSRSSLSYTPSIGSISSKLSSAWTSAKNWWNKSRSSLSYTPSIGSIKDKIVSAWNSAKKWWSSNAKLSTKLNISVPKLTVNWGEVSALGKTFKYPKSFSVKFAANGGIFDQGSLIWAGERGPEVMATAAGGRTGVMNVQQMQDAVYEGVYAAVSAAMRGMNGGGTQEVNVYLDGRQITAAVEKRQHERGASIMGNEVYSY